jgi:hypothetical protein
MRRLLGSALPALLLLAGLSGLASGCGDEEPGSAGDDATSTASGSPSTGTPTKDATGEVDFELVQLLTETAAGGAMSEVAVPLGDDAAVQEFNAQFETDALPARVEDAVAQVDVPDGMLLYGAVVAIGCDAPTDVHVTTDDSGLVSTAAKVPSPHVECFPPMTTVALLLVPASAVG